MDYQVEQWINAPAGHTPGLDQLMTGTALAAEWIFVAVVVLWFAHGWWRRSARDREGAIAALVGAGIALAVNFIIGAIWDRPRPFVAHPTTVHLLVTHSTDASFPSDHASAGFAIAAVLFAYHRRWGTAVLLFAALLGYARVYVGDHYPGDVLAGLVIGCAVAAVLLAAGGRILALAREVVDFVIPPRLQRIPLSVPRSRLARAERSPTEPSELS
jgi:undecaprenyl-diphosphatase